MQNYLPKDFQSDNAGFSPRAIKEGIDNNLPKKFIPNARLIEAVIIKPAFNHWGDALKWNSWFRCSELNRLVGGDNRSYHPYALAIDLDLAHARYGDVADLGEWCASNLYYDKVILEYHDPKDALSGWVHIQIRPFSYDEYKGKKDKKICRHLKQNRMEVYEKNFNMPYERVL